MYQRLFFSFIIISVQDEQSAPLPFCGRTQDSEVESSPDDVTQENSFRGAAKVSIEGGILRGTSLNLDVIHLRLHYSVNFVSLRQIIFFTASMPFCSSIFSLSFLVK